jgi:hypothetical protein
MMSSERQDDARNEPGFLDGYNSFQVVVKFDL